MTFKRTAGLAAAFAAALLVGLGAGPFCPARAQAPGSPDEPGVSSLARALKDSNRTYLGWRIYQDKCARCHGPDATGTKKAPILLVRVKSMSETRFIGTVLRRYNWVLPSGEASGESAAREALIEAIVERQKGEVVMPSWEGEPAVNAHLDDLYQYLTARASGAIGPDRPAWPGK